MRLDRPHRRRTAIDVTSLIDVVFLLLIFFVVTSTFLERPGIDLTLPEAGSAPVASREELTVRLAADGGTWVGEDRVGQEALADTLSARMEREGLDRVVLEADERVPHGRVVQAMDAARRAGAEALVVATRPEEPDRPR
ncbi:MAG: biopolymer transporter ExbD [Gemmatimonadetes bacterium]|nr:biopolymer transporter ExbD [Gemmatimonadota bacterium]